MQSKKTKDMVSFKTAYELPLDQKQAGAETPRRTAYYSRARTERRGCQRNGLVDEETLQKK